MKKILASLLTIAFVCSLSIGLVGCGGNKTSKSTSSPTGGTTQSTESKGTGASTTTGATTAK